MRDRASGRVFVHRDGEGSRYLHRNDSGGSDDWEVLTTADGANYIASRSTGQRTDGCLAPGYKTIGNIALDTD